MSNHSVFEVMTSVAMTSVAMTSVAVPSVAMQDEEIGLQSAPCSTRVIQYFSTGLWVCMYSSASTYKGNGVKMPVISGGVQFSSGAALELPGSKTRYIQTLSIPDSISDGAEDVYGFRGSSGRVKSKHQSSVQYYNEACSGKTDTRVCLLRLSFRCPSR
jgi:hypothetical protein